MSCFLAWVLFGNMCSAGSVMSMKCLVGTGVLFCHRFRLPRTSCARMLDCSLNNLFIIGVLRASKVKQSLSLYDYCVIGWYDVHRFFSENTLPLMLNFNVHCSRDLVCDLFWGYTGS